MWNFQVNKFSKSAGLWAKMSLTRDRGCYLFGWIIPCFDEKSIESKLSSHLGSNQANSWHKATVVTSNSILCHYRTHSVGQVFVYLKVWTDVSNACVNQEWTDIPLPVGITVLCISLVTAWGWKRRKLTHYKSWIGGMGCLSLLRMKRLITGMCWSVKKRLIHLWAQESQPYTIEYMDNAKSLERMRKKTWKNSGSVGMSYKKGLRTERF